MVKWIFLVISQELERPQINSQEMETGNGNLDILNDFGQIGKANTVIFSAAKVQLPHEVDLVVPFVREGPQASPQGQALAANRAPLPPAAPPRDEEAVQDVPADLYVTGLLAAHASQERTTNQCRRNLYLRWTGTPFGWQPFGTFRTNVRNTSFGTLKNIDRSEQ